MNYNLLNFNDMITSFMTLFALIVNNNWQYITLMCVNVVGGNTIYRVYFEVFYYFGVILGVNMFVAFAIDMYSAVTRMDDAKQENEKFLVELAKHRIKQRQEIAKE